MGIRELRINTSRAVRRAMAGERLVITINGMPAAQLGPLNAGAGAATLDDLVAAGLLRRPRTRSPARDAAPVPPPPGGKTTTEILAEHRTR
jgi:antitoxin (DNA-binding transcriptional repressor) of toxin-antitoxin stability system